MAETLARGEPLERAVRLAVAALAEVDEWHAAWAIAEGVGRLPEGATASAIGHVVLLHRRRQFERAWTRVRVIDAETLAREIPVEAVDAAFAAGNPEARRLASAVAARMDGMAVTVLVDLVGRCLAFGDVDQASALAAELRRRPLAGLDARRLHAWTVIQPWLEPRKATIPSGSIPVGVMSYRSPDHVLTSGNLGDYIQSLSLVGNLVRLSDVAFSGDEGLGELASELQQRVQPQLRLPVKGSIHLIPIDRDFSGAADVPPGTWMVAFGWHMHPLFDLRYDFPYHPNIRPLFISFHVNRLDMLSDTARAYLSRYGPVGCRDWNTVFLLLGAGIDAFFTGCLTTTVDALYPSRAAAYRGRGALGMIDLPRKAAGRDARNVMVYSHQSDDVRAVSLAEGLRAADAALAAYQRDLDRAITRRLHAYLPLASLGVPVEFRTHTPGDERFAGLTGLSPGDARLKEMREDIRELIARTFEQVAAGADEGDVYSLWRDLTRARVAEARARFAAPAAVTRTTMDLSSVVSTIRAGSHRLGPHETVDRKSVTDIVLSFDQNLLTPAAVLLQSILANASGPVRLWVLGRGLPDAYPAWLAAAFPSIPMTFLPCDHIAYGPRGLPRRVTSRITVSTMDRLIVPDLLDDVDRVVYLDIDTLMLDDICQLARIDLGGRPMAARDSNVSEASEWIRAGRRLDGELAVELRRQMAQRHGFGHPALNAGVLVLDLDRMRRDDFTATFLGLVERYGLHDQDTLLAYVGPDRAVIEPRWNALPVLEDIPDPSLIHWASFGKPWEPALTYEQDRWRAYAAQVHERVGAPPSTEHLPSGRPGSLSNPSQVGPVSIALSADIERVIDGVHREHLSYLDASSLRTLASSVEAIEAAGIGGLIVEAGTALGGSAITMAAAKSRTRRMKVYDVFGMIPPPGERDGMDVHRRYATIAAGRSRGIGDTTYYGYRDDLRTEVSESFARYGLPIADSNVELIQGLFEDTIKLDEPVALAHLDGDWYASTMTCLTRIAPLLAVGGRLVIDDYDTWSGCHAAVHDYFAERAGYRFERRGRLHVIRE